MKLSQTVGGLCCAILLNLGSATIARAQIGVGFATNTPGARANGMGGAFIGIADDAIAAIANPAGLTSLTSPQVYGEFTSTGGDSLLGSQRTTSPSFGSVAIPMGVFDRFRAAEYGRAEDIVAE
jgi:hypothetical protein